MSGGGGNGGGAVGALIFALVALVLSALSLGLFLLAPFIVFLGGIIAMLISDRKRDSNRNGEVKASEEEAERAEAAR